MSLLFGKNKNTENNVKDIILNPEKGLSDVKVEIRDSNRVYNQDTVKLSEFPNRPTSSATQPTTLPLITKDSLEAKSKLTQAESVSKPMDKEEPVVELASVNNTELLQPASLSEKVYPNIPPARKMREIAITYFKGKHVLAWFSGLDDNLDTLINHLAEQIGVTSNRGYLKLAMSYEANPNVFEPPMYGNDVKMLSNKLKPFLDKVAQAFSQSGYKIDYELHATHSNREYYYNPLEVKDDDNVLEKEVTAIDLVFNVSW